MVRSIWTSNTINTGRFGVTFVEVCTFLQQRCCTACSNYCCMFFYLFFLCVCVCVFLSSTIQKRNILQQSSPNWARNCAAAWDRYCWVFTVGFVRSRCVCLLPFDSFSFWKRKLGFSFCLRKFLNYVAAF